MRRASDQEFWTVVQRLWTFEEPFSRWMRLRKNTARIVPAANSGHAGVQVSTPEEALFSEIFGPRDESLLWVNIYLSIVIAVAETRIFHDDAFEFCSDRGSKFPGKDDYSFSAHRDYTEEISALLLAVGELHSLSALQKSYVAHRIASAPDWSRLRQDGPWSGDARAEFVKILFETTQAHTFSEPFKDARQGTSDSVTARAQSNIRCEEYLMFESTFMLEEQRLRKHLPASFLPRRLLLVEGATEQILLPHFAACIFSDWDDRAVLTIPAGGANQVARRYPTLRQLVTLPIDCVFDGDVSSQAQVVSALLQEGDRLYVLESCAIEEAFPREQIVDLVNAYFDVSGVGAIYSPVTLQELDSTTNQESMEKAWRKRNRGSFDKTGFARVVAENITTPGQIPGEIRDLLTDLCSY